MKLRWIATVALGLGASSLMTSSAMADYRHDDRYDRDRVEHREIDRRIEVPKVIVREDDCDFDREIGLSQVPARVLATLDCERHGKPIEAVQYVRRDGKLFYRFRLDGRQDVNLRISPDGRLLSVQEAGPEYGHVAQGHWDHDRSDHDRSDHWHR